MPHPTVPDCVGCLQPSVLLQAFLPYLPLFFVLFFGWPNYLSRFSSNVITFGYHFLSSTTHRIYWSSLTFLLCTPHFLLHTHKTILSVCSSASQVDWKFPKSDTLRAFLSFIPSTYQCLHKLGTLKILWVNELISDKIQRHTGCQRMQ